MQNARNGRILMWKSEQIRLVF